MKAKEIRDLINFISSTGLAEVNIETEEFKLLVKKSSDQVVKVVESSSAMPTMVQQPAVVQQNTPVAVQETKSTPSDDSSKYVAIKSPMIGTFYRSANPESPAFVNVGDRIEKGKPVCIIEAMKLFNEIESDITGTIVKVMVENATPVEYDQVLFLVDPA